tara:strand:+ start:4534 stop:5511 length:978 start_codon:yes stop_codon:yes gene_type:complete
MIHHGGNLSAAKATFGDAVSGGWIDLSTGINPVPYPASPLTPVDLNRLPEPADEQALIAAARSYYGAAPDSGIIAAPGTQALIQWQPYVRPIGRVDVIAPTYGEHAPRWADAGHTVRNINALDEADADVVVIVNPNNPDGRTAPRDALILAAERQAARGGLLVVDEAFADVAPEVSLSNHAMDGLLVLRSFGKFFGLAGLRLGFAIGDNTVTARLADKLGPWAVSTPALSIGRTALNDTVWQMATRARLIADAAKLDDLLSAAGLVLLGGTNLYRLIETEDAEALYRTLGQAGILIRTFPTHPRWARFGLPATEQHWNRLAAALG